MKTLHKRQIPAAVKRIKSKIPNPDACGALSVTDGHERVGTVVPCDGSFFAFGCDDDLIGEYRSQSEAMRSL